MQGSGFREKFGARAGFCGSRAGLTRFSGLSVLRV